MAIGGVNMRRIMVSVVLVTACAGVGGTVAVAQAQRSGGAGVQVGEVRRHGAGDVVLRARRRRQDDQLGAADRGRSDDARREDQPDEATHDRAALGPRLGTWVRSLVRAHLAVSPADDDHTVDEIDGPLEVHGPEVFERFGGLGLVVEHGYEQLERIDPSPVVVLSKAVALAERDSAEQALPLVEQLDDALDHFHGFHVTRAELLRAAGREAEARDAYARAIALADNTAEIIHLTRRRDELATPPARTALDHLRTLAKDHALTLLTATKDVDHSQAAVLAALLREQG